MTELTVSSKEFAEVMYKMAYTAERVEKNALDLQAQSDQVLTQLHKGQHLFGYSNQTLVEAATLTAELAAVISVAASVGKDEQDRDVMVYLLANPKDVYKIKVVK